ncbi:hypothetical protein ZIOFF_037672 [Zingiber officinale]|uniref:Ubiquitin-like protease family profile domain-containing protein n=1 Tax=Zingiber officinale TaxID=94328 RepID=A0A8J5L4B1_ZINOF|nr:hypothetical protein ZIOFF_037672 [Zingiber officinale]
MRPVHGIGLDCDSSSCSGRHLTAMGALTENRKRRLAVDLRLSSFAHPVFDLASEPSPPSKKIKRISPPVSLCAITPLTQVALTPTPAARSFPPPSPLPRPVHGPQRILRAFGLGSANGSRLLPSPLKPKDVEMGNLVSQFLRVKKAAVFTPWRMGKRDQASSPSSMNRGSDGNDGSHEGLGLDQYVQLVNDVKDGNLVPETSHNNAVFPFSKSGLSDLRIVTQKSEETPNLHLVNRKVEDARKLLRKSSPAREDKTSVKRSPLYKELYVESARKHDTKLRNLDLEVELAEKRISSFRLIHHEEEKQFEERISVASDLETAGVVQFQDLEVRSRQEDLEDDLSSWGEQVEASHIGGHGGDLYVGLVEGPGIGGGALVSLAAFLGHYGIDGGDDKRVAFAVSRRRRLSESRRQRACTEKERAQVVHTTVLSGRVTKRPWLERATLPSKGMEALWLADLAGGGVEDAEMEARGIGDGEGEDDSEQVEDDASYERGRVGDPPSFDTLLREWLVQLRDLKEVFSPLTNEEEEEVDHALNDKNSCEILVVHEPSNIEITKKVLHCLSWNDWLNDEVINLYLELLKEREKREPKKFLKCHFFNTFFYKKWIWLLKEPFLIDDTDSDGSTLVGGLSSLKKLVTLCLKKLEHWCGDCDGKSQQTQIWHAMRLNGGQSLYIFVPIHKEIHWCLAVIHVKEKKLQYLDSLGGMDMTVLRVLAKYLMDEVKDKNGNQIDTSSWIAQAVDDLPLQKNGYLFLTTAISWWDCGMFMLKYTDFYSRGLNLFFQQENMPYFRKRTAKEILRLKAD